MLHEVSMAVIMPKGPAAGAMSADCPVQGMSEDPTAEVLPQHLAFSNLKEVFPNKPPEVLLTALKKANYDVGKAAAALMDEGEEKCCSHRPAFNTPNLALLLPAEKPHDDTFKQLEHSVSRSSHVFAPRQHHSEMLSWSGDRCLNTQSAGRCRCWWPKAGPQASPVFLRPADYGHHDSLHHVHTLATKASDSAIRGVITEAGGEASAKPGLDFDWPEHLQFLNELASPTTRSIGTPIQCELTNAVGDIRLSTATPNQAVSQSRQQDGASCDDAFQAKWHGLQPSGCDTSTKCQPADRMRAGLFAGEEFPEDALDSLAQLKKIFCSLSGSVLENTLREAGYDLAKASDMCFALLSMEQGTATGGWSDSPSEDSESVATDSLYESSSPMHGQKSASYWSLDDAESLQELDFEDKVYKLQKDFPSVTSSEITQYLTASDGVYDTAFALVLQSVDDEQAQAEAQWQQLDKDREAALALQEEESAHKPSVDATSSSHPTHSIVQSGQDDAVDWLSMKDPNMRPRLEHLKSTFPQIGYGALQNLLVASEGDVHKATLMIRSQMPETQLPVKPKSGYSSALQSRPAPGPPSRLSTARPVSPPPGFRPIDAPAAAKLRKQTHRRAHRPEHNDIYTEARAKFFDAQAQMSLCNQEFHSAQRAGDVQKQQLYSTQLQYWQKKCAEEKQRAQKKIVSSKNADISNTFKLDLHALHVDEAIEEIEKTRQDLSRFHCTWMVEAITGKGLHSVGQAQLLPAVKQHLFDKRIEFWDAPGMVVFKLNPSHREGSSPEQLF